MKFIIDLESSPKEIDKAYKNFREVFPLDCVSEELSSEELRELIKRHSWRHYTESLYGIIVHHKNTTPEVQYLMLEVTDYNSEVSNEIATSKAVSLELLMKLAEHEDQFVKEHANYRIARTEGVSLEMLEKLLKNESKYVVEAAETAIQYLKNN